MGEFFKGWRRKVGVLTLVMACMFMAVWIRSSLVIDKIANDFGGHEKLVEMLQGDESGMSRLITIWRVSPVWIILPLSLLSAWLLLGKPRQSNQKRITDSTPAVGQ